MYVFKLDASAHSITPKRYATRSKFNAVALKQPASHREGLIQTQNRT